MDCGGWPVKCNIHRKTARKGRLGILGLQGKVLSTGSILF